MEKIQVGFLVSYDYELLKNAIPLIYNQADNIYLAIDKDHKTWSGKTIHIENSFYDWLTQHDPLNKIHIYKDHFSNPELSTMECEIRERKMLAQKMGAHNWIIQLDADEYFINFEKFTKYLKRKKHLLHNPQKNKVQISPFHVSLYKKTDNGYLFVKKATKTVVATNYPDYKVGRKTNGKVIYVNSLILHECLSRTKEELLFKFKNWGHNNEVNIAAFINKWENVNENNFQLYSNFFFLNPKKWKKLDYVKAKNIHELFINFKQFREKKLYKSFYFILSKNLGQYFKYHFKT